MLINLSYVSAASGIVKNATKNLKKTKTENKHFKKYL